MLDDIYNFFKVIVIAVIARRRNYYKNVKKSIRNITIAL
jgi:hypothetical protein